MEKVNEELHHEESLKENQVKLDQNDSNSQALPKELRHAPSHPKD